MGEWIAKKNLLGDNVDIVLYDCEEQFWLMLLDKGPHNVDVSFETHGPKAMLLLGGIGMKNCSILVVAHIVFGMISLLHTFLHAHY